MLWLMVRVEQAAQAGGPIQQQQQTAALQDDQVRATEVITARANREKQALEDALKLLLLDI